VESKYVHYFQEFELQANLFKSFIGRALILLKLIQLGPGISDPDL